MKRENLHWAFAILLCIVAGVLANESTTLQQAWFHRTVIGGPMLALLFTMIVCNLVPSISKEFKAGTTYCFKQFLNCGIIATGGTLSFAAILGTGIRALPLILFNILLSFTVALVVGRKVLKVSENTSVLVGGGTAIATLSRIVKAKEEEIAFAMAAIFLFDTIAAFSYPYLATALNLTNNQFAFLAGTAINDTSSVAGAQATYQGIIGNPDFSGALNVKLVRTTMLIFVALAWTLIVTAQAWKSGEVSASDSPLMVVKKTFPMFILWFVVMAGLNTFGFFSPKGIDLLGKLGKYLFAAALAGVGFKIKFKDVFSKGVKPIALGGITWLFVAASSLAFIFLFAGYVG